MDTVLHLLIQKYQHLSLEQLHNMTHGFMPQRLNYLKDTLDAMEASGSVVTTKLMIPPSYKTQDYYSCLGATPYKASPVNYQYIKPELFAKMNACPTLGLYFNAARPDIEVSADALDALIVEDIAQTNYFNEVVKAAVGLGAASLPKFADIAVSSTFIRNDSDQYDISIHEYSMEDYYIQNEGSAWRQLLESDNAHLELADIRLRQYVTSQFFHVLFTRPDFLEDGNLFDKAFVRSVHPALTCIHDIVLLTDDVKEQHELFVTTMSGAGPSAIGGLPDGLSM